MRYRKLRITWTVFCGIACVLLICLSVRSYWWNDLVSGRIAGMEYDFSSSWAHVATGISFGQGSPSLPPWQIDTIPNDSSENQFRILTEYSNAFGFGIGQLRTPTMTYPDWFLVLLSATLATVPWIRWKFTLRTLLLAITLIAVVLGLVVWLSK